MKLYLCYNLYVVTEYEGHASIQYVGTYVGSVAAKLAAKEADSWYLDKENNLTIGYDEDTGRVHFIITDGEAHFD